MAVFMRLFLLLFLALPSVAVGQDLTGRVLSAATDAPLVGSTVTVWEQASGDSTLVTGGAADLDGAFVIANVPDGSYRVIVSFVGYTPLVVDGVEIAGADVALGDLSLEATSATLSRAVVTAERQRVQVEVDRTVYNTADDPVASGGNATNVLETIPSVTVDVDGNVSLRGSGNVQVFINGRPAPVSQEFLASYLQQLSAESIERVEVIPNPSSRFAPDGQGGILNLVLEEDAEPGLGGSVAASGDTQGGYSGSGTVTYGTGRWDLTGSLSYRQDEGGGGGTSYRVNRYATPLTYLDQEEVEDESETSRSLNLTADYALTPNTTLSASGQLGIEDELEEELNTSLFFDSDLVQTGAEERLAAQAQDQWNGDLRLGLRHDFNAGRASGARGRAEGGRGASHTLSAELRGTTSVRDETETLANRLIGGDLLDEQRVLSDRQRQGLSLQVDYVRPLGSGRLEAGYVSDLEGLDSGLDSESRLAGGTFTPDVGLSNDFAFDQQVHAVYLQASTDLGALSLQGGLRGEVARTTFDLTGVSTGYDGPLSYDNNYESLFPSAFASYALSDLHTLKASYSRRIDRPNSWRLNPFPSFDDPLNIRVGNPELQPEYIDSFEAGYVGVTKWGSVTLTPYYRRTANAVTRVSTVRPDGVTVRTFENLATAQAYGIESVLFVEGSGLFDGASGFASLEGFRIQTNGIGTGLDLENDAFGWGGRVNLSYGLGDRMGVGDLDLQANVRYRAPIDSEQGRVGSRVFADLALRQGIGEQASLTLRARDPLGMAGFQFTLDQPTLYQEFERDWGAQQIGLTFTYSFQPVENERREDRGGRGGGGFGGEEF